MPKLPQISAKEIIKVLHKLNFKLKSQRGSHIKFIREYEYGKETIIIPNHKVLRPGTLHSILKQLNLDVNKFQKLL